MNAISLDNQCGYPAVTEYSFVELLQKEALGTKDLGNRDPR